MSCESRYPSGDSEIMKLTPREQEVIVGMIRDQRDAEISERLGISRRTVNHHAENILKKLGVRTRAGAVARWLRAEGVVVENRTPMGEQSNGGS